MLHNLNLDLVKLPNQPLCKHFAQGLIFNVYFMAQITDIVMGLILFGEKMAAIFKIYVVYACHNYTYNKINDNSS